MSRFQDWNYAQHQIIQFLKQIGFELDIRGVKGRADRYQGVEVKKIVDKYCHHAKLKGSYSTRLLLIAENAKAFREYIKANKTTTFSKYIES